MTGHLPDQFFSKDDNASLSSSMDDSAYMSQPDTNKRGTGAPEGFPIRSPQEFRNHSIDPFLENNMQSPTLNSENGPFRVPQSDMSHTMLPPSAADTDSGDSTFRFPDFANYSTDQGYGLLHGSSVTRFYTSASEIEIGHGNWPTADASNFSGPFAMGPIENNNYLLAQQFYSRSFQDASGMSFAPMHAMQRTHLRRPTLDTSSTSIPESVNNSTPLSAGPNDQVFRSIVASVLSPTSTVVSIPQRASIAESEITEHKRTVDSAKVDHEDVSTLVTSSVKDDELDEEMLSASQSQNDQKSLEEAESKLARTHPLYQAQPGEDDLYHCPNEGQPGCTHKPTKLKCNYDKYVDSHLRPFRCKVKSCVGLQFSSTACLLRHEREAHGMHGHGSKPHLCSYQDCERSIPGNGFPRRYNLYDHMRRVHDYTDSTSPPQRTSSPTQSGQPVPKRQGSRKRKMEVVDETGDKRRKASAVKSQPSAPTMVSAQSRLAQQKRDLRSDWTRCKSLVEQRLKSLEAPHDTKIHHLLCEDIATLSQIAKELVELG